MLDVLLVKLSKMNEVNVIFSEIFGFLPVFNRPLLLVSHCDAVRICRDKSDDGPVKQSCPTVSRGVIKHQNIRSLTMMGGNG